MRGVRWRLGVIGVLLIFEEGPRMGKSLYLEGGKARGFSEGD